MATRKKKRSTATRKKKRKSKSRRPTSGPAFARYMARKRAEARARRSGGSAKKGRKKSTTRSKRSSAKRGTRKRTSARSSTGGKGLARDVAALKRDVSHLKADNQRHYEFALGLTNIVRRNYGEPVVRSLPGYSPLIRQTAPNKPRALPAPNR